MGANRTIRGGGRTPPAHGIPPVVIVDQARLAETLPGYEIGAELGSGAFGLVLAGRHRGLNRPVAVKVLAAGRARTVTGFASEAQLLAKMDHSHVVRVYDYIETDTLRPDEFRTYPWIDHQMFVVRYGLLGVSRT